MSEPVAEAPSDAQKNAEAKRGCLGCLGILVLLAVFGAMCSPDEEETSGGTPQTVATQQAAPPQSLAKLGLQIEPEAFIAGWNSQSDSKISGIEFKDGMAQITLKNEQALQLWGDEEGKVKEAMLLFASNEIRDAVAFLVNRGAMVAATQPGYSHAKRTQVFEGLGILGEKVEDDITDETEPRTVVVGPIEYGYSYIQGTAFTFTASRAETPAPEVPADPVAERGLHIAPNTFLTRWNEVSEQKLSDIPFENWGAKIDLRNAQLLYVSRNESGTIKEANILLTIPATAGDAVHFINNAGAIVAAVEPGFTVEQQNSVLTALRLTGKDMNFDSEDAQQPRTHVVGRAEYSFRFVPGLGYNFVATLAE